MYRSPNHKLCRNLKLTLVNRDYMRPPILWSHGSYRPRAARRIMIPKADGGERPISVFCLENKIVQQGVVKVLEGIYENDFRGFSYTDL